MTRRAPAHLIKVKGPCKHYTSTSSPIGSTIPLVSNVIPLNPAPSPLRILVVDDHLDGVHSLVRLLEAHGHAVTFAINGFAALEAAREFKPNVVIVDMRLPDMTGLDVARQLKFEPGLEGVRIIGLSGSPEYRRRALEYGIAEFVLKPATSQEWQALLDGAGGKRESDGAAGR
jgi:CheY-like chemotaxis protein